MASTTKKREVFNQFVSQFPNNSIVHFIDPLFFCMFMKKLQKQQKSQTKQTHNRKEKSNPKYNNK